MGRAQRSVRVLYIRGGAKYTGSRGGRAPAQASWEPCKTDRLRGVGRRGACLGAGGPRTRRAQVLRPSLRGGVLRNGQRVGSVNGRPDRKDDRADEGPHAVRDKRLG